MSSLKKILQYVEAPMMVTKVIYFGLHHVAWLPLHVSEPSFFLIGLRACNGWVIFSSVFFKEGINALYNSAKHVHMWPDLGKPFQIAHQAKSN